MLAALAALVLVAVAVGVARFAQRPDTSSMVVATPSAPAGAPSVATPTGWRTFSSPEYPITFSYPSGWKTSGRDGTVDGCDINGCLLTLSAPEGEYATPVALVRNGFAGPGLSPRWQAPDLRAKAGGLLAWGEATAQTAGEAVVVRTTHDYSLAAYDATGERVSTVLAVGSSNPIGANPESLFQFHTDIEDVDESPEREASNQLLVQILASARENPGFAPTRPVTAPDGHVYLPMFDEMAAPELGTVAPDATWQTLTVDEAGISVRYPADWTVRPDTDQPGVSYLTAPSGYRLEVRLSRDDDDISASPPNGTSSLGAVPGVEVSGSLSEPGSEGLDSQGTPEVRFRNGGEFSASAYLALTSSDGLLSQDLLRYGDHTPVRVGGVDNELNPSPDELDQAVAILASVTQIG